MEHGGSWSNFAAQGLIVLFLLFLLALFIRTSMMFGSVVVLALTRDRRKDGADVKLEPPFRTDTQDEQP